jgi:hypothetical protein
MAASRDDDKASASGTNSMTDTTAQRIEDVYRALKSRGGQEAQLAHTTDAKEIAAAFKRTVGEVRTLTGRGPFYPPGTRKPLADLLAEAGTKPKKLADTSHLQAMLWAPTRWQVEDHPELDFHFVERELTPGSAVSGTTRTWMIDKKHQLSADALLINADDRTPIVAEIKVAGDQNAQYGLIQALAAAAQLSTPSQLKRLRTAYRDYFGPAVPACVDVYVILADRPPRGTRPKLLKRAIEIGDAIVEQDLLSPWIRRICFLEAVRADSAVLFRKLAAAIAGKP